MKKHTSTSTISMMKSILLINLLIIPFGISVALPLSNRQFSDLECINYFLTNRTTFSRQQHFILLLSNTSNQANLENVFLETQIVNRSIALKFIDQAHNQFDGKSFYIAFMAENELEGVETILNRAKGVLHIILGTTNHTSDDESKMKIQQLIENSKNISDELILFFHVKSEKRWKLYETMKHTNASDFEVFSIGECTVMESYPKRVRSNESIFRVVSPSAAPMTSFSGPSGSHIAMDYKMLQLISEKLQKPLHFEYLNATAYHDVLRQIIHGNLSESMQMLVEEKRNNFF